MMYKFDVEVDLSSEGNTFTIRVRPTNCFRFSVIRVNILIDYLYTNPRRYTQEDDCIGGPGTIIRMERAQQDDDTQDNDTQDNDPRRITEISKTFPYSGGIVKVSVEARLDLYGTNKTVYPMDGPFLAEAHNDPNQ